jgi:hypothetical protein
MLTGRKLSTLLRSQETHRMITGFLSEKFGKYGKITAKINMLGMVIGIWLTQT